MMIKHTPECLATNGVQQKEYDTWLESWPNHCEKCEGWGVNAWYENQSPIGSGMVWNELIEESCEYCVWQGNCPRCGTHNRNWTEDKIETEPNRLRCKKCGWTEEIGGAPPAPDYPCPCQLEEAHKAQEEWMHETYNKFDIDLGGNDG